MEASVEAVDAVGGLVDAVAGGRIDCDSSSFSSISPRPALSYDLSF